MSKAMSKTIKGVLSATVAIMLLNGCSHTKPYDEDIARKGSKSWQDQQDVVAGGIGEDAAFPGNNAGVADRVTGIKNNTIYFAYDRSTIEPEYRQIIEANARYLKAHPNARVRLEGHTDPRGSREYNVGLGQRRADQVANQLLAMNVPNDEMAVVSYGKEKLARSGTTEEDYRLDRRVEIIYEER